jgi:hypothetical protein
VGLSENKIEMENGRIGMWEIKWFLLNEIEASKHSHRSKYPATIDQ